MVLFSSATVLRSRLDQSALQPGSCVVYCSDQDAGVGALVVSASRQVIAPSQILFCKPNWVETSKRGKY